MQCEMEAREECAGGFKKETVNKLLQLHFKDDKTRASGDAVLLMAEMLKVFVREAAARGARQARTEDVTRVEVEHVEKSCHSWYDNISDSIINKIRIWAKGS